MTFPSQNIWWLILFGADEMLIGVVGPPGLGLVMRFDVYTKWRDCIIDTCGAESESYIDCVCNCFIP